MLVACRDTPRPRTNVLRVLAGTTMPPRPIEPPSMKHYEWTVTHNGEQFVAQHSRMSLPRRSHFAASMAVSLGGQDIDQLTLDLIALRDGPLPVVTP